MGVYTVSPIILQLWIEKVRLEEESKTHSTLIEELINCKVYEHGENFEEFCVYFRVLINNLRLEVKQNEITLRDLYRGAKFSQDGIADVKVYLEKMEDKKLTEKTRENQHSRPQRCDELTVGEQSVSLLNDSSCFRNKYEATAADVYYRYNILPTKQLIIGEQLKTTLDSSSGDNPAVITKNLFYQEKQKAEKGLNMLSNRFFFLFITPKRRGLQDFNLEGDCALVTRDEIPNFFGRTLSRLANWSFIISKQVFVNTDGREALINVIGIDDIVNKIIEERKKKQFESDEDFKRRVPIKAGQKYRAFGVPEFII
ncbi:nop16 [Acrasis kona]|uniref:Nop16 n=1 Tax=Acrasis kona TaxID=1008807 RepID=A0AAW2YIK8_9EUKA